jgi:5S rRNA maturation endonuclease (ribonuclease M5)
MTIKARQLLNRREVGEDNPILNDNEMAWCDVTKQLKIGDGITEFDDLPDIGGYVGSVDVDETDIADGRILVYEESEEEGKPGLLVYRNLNEGLVGTIEVDETDIGADKILVLEEGEGEEPDILVYKGIEELVTEGLVGSIEVDETDIGADKILVLEEGEGEDPDILVYKSIDEAIPIIPYIVQYLGNRVVYGLTGSAGTITYTDAGGYSFGVNISKGGEINKKFISKNGIVDYLNKIIQKPIIKPFYMEKKIEGMEIELTFSYSENDGEDIRSFVNGVETVEGGTHNTGFKMGLTQVITKYINENALIPKKDSNITITGEDVREGLIAILNCKHKEPLFEGQTKNKLTNNDMLGFMKKLVTDELVKLLQDDKVKAKKLCERIILAAKSREASKKAKQAIKKKADIFSSISNLSKYTKCSSKDPEKREIFIVEGDSAAGTSKQARSTEFHSIYALRGKPLNTHDLNTARILANKEFSDIITILGCGVDSSFEIENLKYNKIIFLTDSDIDGSHISALLMTFFFKHCPELIKKGHVYIAQPPLYKIKENKKEVFIKNKEEYNKFISKKIEENFKSISFSANKIK